MKKTMKNILLIAVTVSLILFSCSTDEDSDKEVFTPLEAVSYQVESVEVQEGEPFTGDAITMTPEGAEASFEITQITKDGEVFTNPEKGFKLDTFGKIAGDANNELTGGDYEITITAVDKGNGSNKKTTTFTVNVLFNEPSQPISTAPDNTFAGTIGFWDFSASGNNSVTDESGNWTIDGISYGEQGLVLDESVSKMEAENSRVQLFDPSGDSGKGLFQQRYFSGAVKFKVVKDPDEAFSYPVLSFGYDNRFLDLEIFNGQIRMMTNNSNIANQTDLEVPEKVWNVLYFRYEGFLAPNDNKFYLQLNDGEEVVIDLKDFEIDEFAKNDDINLGFSSRGIIFKGSIDWIIMGRGRMTPGNAQYLVGDFQV